MRLTQRVLLGSLLIVGVLATLVVALADRRVERRMVRETVIDLSREAELIASQWRPGLDPDSLADDVGAHLGHRVTLIDSTGTVVGDADFDRAAMSRLENHNHRPEVMAARDTGMGWSRRPSASAGDEELYVAVRAPLGVARVSMSTAALDDIVGGAQRDVLIAALLATLVALVVTLLFARSVSRPIEELRDVARRMATGDLAQRPQLSASGEVGDLADALARMGEQLQARINALASEDALLGALVDALDEGVLAIDASGMVVRVNRGAQELLGLRDRVPFSVLQLPRDRSLRETISAALSGETVEPVESIVAGRALAIRAHPLRAGGAVVALLDLTPFRRLEAVRRDFVANVSHELRTPLTIIGGFAETLADDTRIPAESQRFVGTIRTNAQRMQRIVDDLLDLSRIESGGWQPAPEWVSAEGAAREAVAACVADAQAKGVQVAIDTDAAPHLFADPTAVRQVLANLVSNAVRHTERGSITVFTRPQDGGVLLGVRDTGSGIPDEHLSRIWERFYRVDPSRSRAEGGTGLGLSIVRHLVEAHGGRVHADSVVGEGTTISALFPSPAGGDGTDG